MRSVRKPTPAHEVLLTRFGSKLPPVLRTQGFGYVFGPVAVVLVTVLLELLLAQTRLGNASTIYALIVLVTAALYGRTPALPDFRRGFRRVEHRQGTLQNQQNG